MKTMISHTRRYSRTMNKMFGFGASMSIACGATVLVVTSLVPLSGADTTLHSPSQPHWRYLGAGGYVTQFDYGSRAAVESISEVSYSIDRTFELDHDGYPVYSLRFDWTWKPTSPTPNPEVIAEATQLASTDYRPTFAFPVDSFTLLVAGVDRNGAALVERWTIGKPRKREVADGNGVIVARALVPGDVTGRARGFHDVSAALSPINAMSEVFAHQSGRACIARTAVTGELFRLTLAAVPSGTYTRLYGPSDVPTIDTGVETVDVIARVHREFQQGAYLFPGIVRSTDTPALGDTTYQLRPHPEVRETSQIQTLVLVDIASNDSIDALGIAP